MPECKHTCKDCDFVKKMETKLVGTWLGECRRFPPLLLCFPDTRGATGLMSKWPSVSDIEGFYCYELTVRGVRMFDEKQGRELEGARCAADDWNKRYIPGQHVKIEDVRGLTDERAKTTTISRAFVLNGQAVVRCGDLGGFFPLSSLRPY